MRTFIAVLLFSTGPVYSACPDLSSVTTVCRSSTGEISGNENQVITQEKSDGVTTYYFSADYGQAQVSKTYIADGKSRREMIVDQNSGITLLNATTITCKDDALLEHTTSFIDGQFLGVMDVKTTMKSGVITRVFEGLRWGRDVDDTIVCQ